MLLLLKDRLARTEEPILTSEPIMTFYITRDHKVVYIPWDISFMNPLYIKGYMPVLIKYFPSFSRS